MKDPKDMTTEELIELADEIKRGMTTEFLRDMENIRTARKLMKKEIISKQDAIKIADAVKRGMSIAVMKDLAELKRARSKVLMAK